MEQAVHYVSSRLENDIRPLTRNQQKNLETLIRISDAFHSDAGVRRGPGITVSEKLIVIESGHQPNFLPYPGVWKKVFLMDRIFNHLKSKDHDAIAVFGFADQNLSTAKVLYENKLPAVNKLGYKKFGFRIKESEKWKRFNTISKPSQEDWERELGTLKEYYARYLRNLDPDSAAHTIGALTDIMTACYLRADNRADLNAFIFARMCQDLFGFRVHFFRYSDVQHESLFRDEWQQILGSASVYASVYNKTIHEHTINLAPLPAGFIPFWYHCPCGSKVTLTTGEVPGFRGTCPACRSEFSLLSHADTGCLEIRMKEMGLSAVARNVVFSAGLGTRLFISGSGGGLRYGRVANEISGALSLNIPITLSWKSRDYYLGIIHRSALKDLLKLFHLTWNDLAAGSLEEKITWYRKSLRDHIRNLEQGPENKQEMAKYSGLYRNTATQVTMTKKMFSTIPSVLDLLVTFPGSSITSRWDEAMNGARIHDTGETVLLCEDVSYPGDNEQEFSLQEIPRIYHSLDAIKERKGQ